MIKGSGDILEEINRERNPLNGTFELTARCNLRCKMCMIRIDEKRMSELGGRERTAEEWIHMAKEVYEAGTIGLLLTGGEPMLRPDFIQIYKAIAQMGFMLTLYTNATLVTPKIMEVLREYPPHRIGITAYGASPQTYEKVTGNANAYYRMLDGVEQLRHLPSKFMIRTTLIKDNIEDLDKITEWACSFGKNVEFNVSRIVTKPVRGGIANVEACRLTPEENVAMLKKRTQDNIVKPFHEFVESQGIVAKREEQNQRQNQNQEVSQQDKHKYENNEKHVIKKKHTLYGCDAGMNSYTITWDGKLIGCQMLSDGWTYPFEKGFHQAWEAFPKQVKIPPLPEQCVSCEIACNACPATRLAETKCMNGLPEYLCKESKLVKKMKENLIAEMQQLVDEKG